MGKTFGWRSLLVVLAAACTGETVTAPGACPAFCTGITVQATDSVLRGAVRGDSTFFGYVAPQGATEMVVAGPGSMVESRAVLRFYPFVDTIPLNAGDTTRKAVVQTDSFHLSLRVGRRTPGLTDLRVALYRLPVTVDSLSSFADLDPFFADSTFITDFAVPAGIGVTDSLVIPFSPDLLPTFKQDSLRVVIGVALRSASPAFMALGVAETANGAVLNRFMKVDSATGAPAARIASLGTELDTYVFAPPPPPGPGVLTVGSSPSARTFIRLDLPRRIVDSTNVVRATLLLVPASPVVAAPGDTLVVIAYGLASDVGPKSPLLTQSAIADSGTYSGARLVAGSTDTIRVDITALFRFWRSDTMAARSLVLRSSPEGGSFGEIRFWSTRDAVRRPVIDVTYVPPIRYQGP